MKKLTWILAILLIYPILAQAEEVWVVNEEVFSAFKFLTTFDQYVQAAEKAQNRSGEVDMKSPAGQRFQALLEQFAVSDSMFMLPKGTEFKIINVFPHSVSMRRGKRTWDMAKIVSEDSPNEYFIDLRAKGKPDSRMVRRVARPKTAPVRYVVDQDAHGYFLCMSFHLTISMNEKGDLQTIPLFNAGLKSGAILPLERGTEITTLRKNLNGGMALTQIGTKQYWVPTSTLRQK